MIRVVTGVFLLALSAGTHAATFVLRSLDGVDEGFNDPTPFAPAGGNTATTIGQARMNVLQEAGRIWGALLRSDVEILVDARFDALTCAAMTGTLGQGGPRGYFFNFAGAPTPNVFYAAALADSLAGRNLSSTPGNADIGITLNSSVGSDAGCLGGRGFYLGFDHGRGTQIDLLNVVLHELGHGLGFASEVDAATGAPFFNVAGSDRFSSYVHRLYDESLGLGWPQLNNTQRMESAVRTGSLAWTGPRANAQLNRFAAGGTINGRFRMNAPAILAGGSSVSHWDSVVSPNALMEPNLPSFVFIGSVDITACALEDIGWRVNRCPDDAPLNTAPLANTQTVTGAEDAPIVITLTGSDANNDTLSFSLGSTPVAGTLSTIASIPPHTITYTPVANFNGNDGFSFVVNDGTIASSPATVSIVVTPVNDAPTAVPQNAVVQPGQTVNILLGGADVDGDPVSYAIASSPTFGVLSGAAPNLSYRPNDGFVGTDNFTYRSSDGALQSALTTVTVTVAATASTSSSGASDSSGGGGGSIGSEWWLLLAINELRRRRIAAHRK